MDAPDPVEHYLTVCRAARLLHLSPASVRRRIARGQLAAVRDRVSGRYLVPAGAVLGLLAPVAPAPDARPVSTLPMHPGTAATLRRFGVL